MTPTTRVRLTADFTDEFGQPFKAGQIGTCSGAVGREFLVSFDGYEEAKQRDKELRATRGEGANVVPWAAIIPGSLLEAVEP